MIRSKFKIRSDIFLYTIFFCITMILVYYGFWKANKTLIWQTDGFRQHFPAMYQVRENLRTILESGFKEIPFWNWNLGLGLNLSCIYTYDIFYWFTIFLPKEFLVGAYGFFIILKLYLSGLFLILYLKEINIKGYSSIIGGLVYSFCGYALYAGIRHPFFVSPMFIFPLIILGIEKYLVKKQGKLLIVAVFIATVSHYYFLYMMGIGAIIYTVIRCYSLFGNKYKEYFNKIFNIGIRSMLGMGMGAFAILPNIYMFFKSNREGTQNAVDLIYNKSYYGSFVTSFIGPKINGSWTALMFSGITMIIIPLIYTKLFNEFKYIRRIFVGMTLMLFVPYIGSVMNGFGYVCNRWVFMYAFFVACIVAIGISNIKLLERKYFIPIVFCIILYLISVLIVEKTKIQYIISFLFSIIILGIIISIKNIKNYKNNNIAKAILIFVVILNIAYLANWFYRPIGENYRGEFVDNNNILEKYSQNINSFKKSLTSNEFFRTDQTYYGKGNQYSDTLASNDGLVTNINSSAQYVSLPYRDIFKFYEENGLFNIKSLDSTMGYDNNNILESLLSVKYKTIKKDDEKYLGKGYELIDKEGDYELYENKDVLPIGVLYSNYITREDYMNLPKIDKSMALLQGVILEDERLGEGLNKVKPEKYSEKLDYKVNKNNDIEVKDNKIIVKRENAELTLSVNIPLDSEIYLDIEGLDKNQKSSKNVYVSRNGKEKSILLRSEDDIYNTKQKDKLVTLGYTSKALQNEKIKLRFADKGTYTFDELNIKAVNMKDYNQYIENLKNQEMTNIEYGTNYIKGNINSINNSIMFFSIPYDEGWTVEVDGHKVDTFKLDTGFLGINLSSGKHSISLKFYPPGLNLGLGITCISILILGIWYFLKTYKKQYIFKAVLQKCLRKNVQ